jgi:hypothetical protein
LDVLDAVGAGVGLGAAVGGFDGGAIVGCGLGAEEALPGWEFEVAALGAAWCADRALRWPDLLADGDGEGLPDDADAVGLVPAGDWFPVVVPTTPCAAVLANSVAITNAATRLSNVTRKVILDRRISRSQAPVSHGRNFIRAQVKSPPRPP